MDTTMTMSLACRVNSNIEGSVYSSGTSGVRQWWCERLFTTDIELLCVSLLPFYLPREFPQIFLTVVYIQPKAHFDRALDIIFNLSHKYVFRPMLWNFQRCLLCIIVSTTRGIRPQCGLPPAYISETPAEREAARTLS